MADTIIKPALDPHKNASVTIQSCEILDRFQNQPEGSMGPLLSVAGRKGAALAAAFSLGLASCTSPPTQPSDNTEQSIARDPYARRQVYTETDSRTGALSRTVALPPVPTNPAQCDAWFNQVMALERDDIDSGKPRVGEFFHPELMAMGDSLYNGVQSLRINWFLSEWSAPNLVAIRLGLIQEQNGDRTGQRRFYSPQYPSFGSSADQVTDYGLNLENLPGIGGTLIGGPRHQADLLDDLMSGRSLPNVRPFVDNISFLSATSFDLLNWTPKDYRNAAEKPIRRMRQGLLPILSLSDALYNANAAFVLNPTRNICLEERTPLEQVVWREPLTDPLILRSGVYPRGEDVP